MNKLMNESTKNAKVNTSNIGNTTSSSPITMTNEDEVKTYDLKKLYSMLKGIDLEDEDFYVCPHHQDTDGFEDCCACTGNRRCSQAPEDHPLIHLNDGKEDLKGLYDYIQANYVSKEELKITENTSDGFHTFKELYEFRMLYNACWFNELCKSGGKVLKSKKHSDGELCFGGGWFIVMAELPTGQISNHYELKDWDLFVVPEWEKAMAYDGHTPKDVMTRLNKYLKSKIK